MSGAPRVAVVVLNYNGLEITRGALKSVLAMDYPNFDAIHVDNGSSDGSFERIAAEFPTVTQVRTETNLGVAGGYNLGMRFAIARGYDYLLILNNDLEVDAALLSELVAVAEREPTIGCVGPKAYYFDDRSRLWSTGGILRFRETPTKERGEGEIDRGQYDRDEERRYVNGCGMLIRRQAIEAAGLWDPIYQMCIEDADWCVRIRAAGFRIWYAHRARLYHMVSRSTGVYAPRRTYQSGRSAAIFARRYASPWNWLTFAAWALAALPAAFVRELFRGNQRAVIEKARGLWHGLRVALPKPPMLGDPAPVDPLVQPPRAVG